MDVNKYPQKDLETDSIGLKYTHLWFYTNDRFQKASDKSNLDKSRLNKISTYVMLRYNDRFC